MKSLVSLFLSQSYQDAWDDYMRSLNRADFARWDYVILTASNERQADGFYAQLERRRAFLPEQTHFAVLPDPDGKRVGSGGATLNVIRYIAQREGRADFQGLRILVIHSGGDSRRAPQYSALGKLFSPVPRALPDGRSSTLFDEFMIAMSSVPARIREGMFLLAGDVLLLFNPLQIDYNGNGAAVISFKENVETGKNHGVYLRGSDGNVAVCLQKQPVETLRKAGAVNGQDCVDIDTGAVIFSAAMLSSLYGLISDEGRFNEEKYRRYVNEKVRLSLYVDFLYPMGRRATLEQFYKEKPEGDFSRELTECRKAVWDAIHPYSMKLLRLAPAKFIHFGTTKEIMRLMSEEIGEYGHLGWNSCVNSSIAHKGVFGYNSILSQQAVCGENVYLEVSYVHHRARIGNNVLLSYVDIHDETIPDNVAVHGLKLKDGHFVVRIFGIGDNPKEGLQGSFLGTTLEAFLEKNKIRPEELWNGAAGQLWQANLYPICKNVAEGVAAALNLYAMAQGGGDVESWRQAKRQSLWAGFNEANTEALIAWDRRMQELVTMDRLAKDIQGGCPVGKIHTQICPEGLTEIQQSWLEKRLQRTDYSERMRLHYYIGRILKGQEGERHISECFRTIQQSILSGSREMIRENKECRIVKERHKVRLPLRVNWGGGWSDTPPYCNENGGTVLNAAILLKGRMPVEVSLEKLAGHRIVFDSRDMDAHGEFTGIEELQKVGDPYDPFVLQKAALIACGVIPAAGGSLEEILARLGGGILMRSEVTGVPQGSGLGTSSILAGGCVKALLEFMGIPYSENELYSYVSVMEQMMSTGGGWQDQVGGLSGGIKYITTMPGLVQDIRVEHLQIPAEAWKELRERFVLIYTGQRRLARNLLRDVVGRYIGNEPDSLYALNEIQRLAALMRFELERGHVDDFAKLLDKHWELSKMIDAGSTNTLIDQIFASINGLIDGRLVCGAGGGGFLQAILKKGVTREEIDKRLGEVFQDSDVGVYDAELV
ncbi:MAG: bifunctional fucokinase/L-fucose-1-P-guanylyltransferase [Clostridium sp.]|nr:bifunctional fucokinase/L-fucose-1-P-guanylyltransferase [Clostridium sp.]